MGFGSRSFVIRVVINYCGVEGREPKRIFSKGGGFFVFFWGLRVKVVKVWVLQSVRCKLAMVLMNGDGASAIHRS